MKEERKQHKIKGVVLGSVIALAMVFCLGYTGWSIWQKYKVDIIDKQKEQMQIIAGSLAENLQNTMYSYMEGLNFLGNTLELNRGEGKREEYLKQLMADYMDNENDYIEDLTIQDPEDKVIWNYEGIGIEKIYGSYQLKKPKVLFIEGKGNDGNMHFFLQKEVKSGCLLTMTIDIQSYYEDLISDIKLGANGYIVVKNSEGIIFMHPAKEQLGETVITGREQLYEGVDLTSLKAMVEEQNTKKSGVCEYYSYWWTNESLPRVKKISAFDRAVFGDDYMIVSAVMDYDDIYKPIAASFVSISFAFLGILIVILGFWGVFVYFAVQRQQASEEIEYLKNLNKVLEETKRGEEVIAHQQRLQIMGTMAGGISHEFNNMLTPIMGYSEMLLDELDPKTLAYDFAEEILLASDKAKDVIRQISGFSRKNMETVFQPVTVKKMLNRSIKMIRSVCPANTQIELEISLSKEEFLGREAQINQVLLNLAVNAFHAMKNREKGILKIRAYGAKPKEIEKKRGILVSEEVEDYICLAVEDNGCGMKPEVLEQIFNPFFTTKVSGQGTGLGLAITEQIIHSHKGYITAESEYEKGSCFYIYLPMLKKNSIRELPREENGEKLRFLVIDDNEKILRLLEKRFKKLGIFVMGVGSTAEAREKLKEMSYDVLLIDQDLSKKGTEDAGIYFAMSIKGMYPNMIKIIMTDQVKKEIIEAKQNGMIDAYLKKPVSDTEIIDIIRKIGD